ncbi:MULTISPECIES: class I SAM-dependent methyltransferase [Mycobacterium avium complex (MAC)]|uniref:SAM-dependent methyltransferase n=3 Tax=Mycobacterium avium complex (MAC) TaxID=120793 RepID=A0AAW5SBC1_MYCBC|nr:MULTISPECIES: class I SAM-dependent methyltransferase [Mycobacterium avium complex (MAC)]ETA96100.1 SAM-dependent methyltransferase [Mycobacterium avium 05-4293]ETB15935.1 SAM-dependent methyltransferase [Mycobacterium avium subsp. silvaticum ATCC 49884]ETB30033.1 SAM-dependent methyltransferase [Mycobacterium avium 09-5983]ETB45323.1 SAM-dependent methyltransferase [Mycobacterium avium subsp. hominissuis 10-5606]ETB52202.1 SAM-dependent methyltransferase [Mycobacterium avium 11-0986]TXA43
MAVTDIFARRATLARSVRLLSQFRYERSEPARFYGALAADTAAMVDDLWRAGHGESAAGRTLLDVGGGPGYFAAAFADAGVRYLGVEPDPGEMHAAGPVVAADTGTFVRASGMALPFADDSVDICLSSNVAEHVPRPWQLGAEMLRVTRPGGLAVLSYTVWLGPFGGHEMGLTHYLGGSRAAARYARKHGHPAKNNYGSSLFEVSVADGLAWAACTGAELAAFPRYHPRWAWWLTSVPVLREFLVSNLVLVLQPQ